MEAQPQKVSTSYHGARVVRRSDRCSNVAVKTGTVLVRDTGDPDRNTLQFVDLPKLFPPYHTDEEKRKDNMLIPLSKVSVFAKHYNANVMYYTLFGLAGERDGIDLKVSCISRTEVPITDFAVGIVPTAYRHTKQPFVRFAPCLFCRSRRSFIFCPFRLRRAPEVSSSRRQASLNAQIKAQDP